MVLLWHCGEKTLLGTFIFRSVWWRMCVPCTPHAISKIFSFPCLVLTTAGFILAGVSQTEWSLSRDFSITGCARPHSAANQIFSVLLVPTMGGSGGLSGFFHLPPSHLSLSTVTLLFKCFAEEWCYSLEPTCPRLCVFKMYKPSCLVGWWNGIQHWPGCSRLCIKPRISPFHSGILCLFDVLGC